MNIKHNTQVLIQAAKNGNVNDLKILIPISDPKWNDSAALRAATMAKCASAVKLLIPVSDPKAMDSTPLRLAAIQGDIECLKLLLPVSEPKAMDSGALRVATHYGHTKCVDLLFDVSDPHVVLNELQSDYPNSPEKWQYLADKIAIVEQRRILCETVKNAQSISPTVARKI